MCIHVQYTLSVYARARPLRKSRFAVRHGPRKTKKWANLVLSFYDTAGLTQGWYFKSHPRARIATDTVAMQLTFHIWHWNRIRFSRQNGDSISLCWQTIAAIFSHIMSFEKTIFISKIASKTFILLLCCIDLSRRKTSNGWHCLKSLSNAVRTPDYWLYRVFYGPIFHTSIQWPNWNCISRPYFVLVVIAWPFS